MFNFKSLVWMGDRQLADEFDVHEVQPLVLQNDDGKYWASLSIFRFGAAWIDAFEGPYPDPDSAQARAIEMKKTWKPLEIPGASS